MTRNVSTDLLAELSAFVAARMGLHFPPERWRDLARGIQSAARELGFADAEAYARRLLASAPTRREFEILASHLTVGETYFFRERQALDALREQILPDLIRARRGGDRRLRIWSAGCSTGEEAYTIAMLLDGRFPEIKKWQLDLVATDINPHSLRKAAKGVYGEWSFRGTPAWVKERYFREVGGGYELDPRVKRMVSFSYLNLASDAYPSLVNNTNAIDVIFCRNVLMYFSAEQARRVVANFSHALVAGGWFVVSQSELSGTLFNEFAPVNFPGAILYRKKDAESQTAAGGLNRINEAAIFAPPPCEFTTAREAEKLFVYQPEEIVVPEVAECSEAETTPTEYEKALACYEQGLYREATELLNALAIREPENSQALVLLARACANTGALAEARRWCERAIAADKMNAGVHYLRATVLQEQHETAEATKSLRRALYLDQNFALAHFALGNLARGQGKRKESERHFANALALLDARAAEEVLPEAGGMTAGRLAEIIRQATYVEGAT